MNKIYSFLYGFSSFEQWHINLRGVIKYKAILVEGE